MANPHMGEVEFTVRNKTYTLSFSINAMCELEEALGQGVTQLADMMADPTKLRIKDVRAVFWAGLRDHHEAIAANEAGRIMTDLGMAKAMELVGKAFALAFPEVEAGAGPLAADKAVVGQALRLTGKQH